jgi:DNA-binding NarL/FixJ family response regulator
MINRILLVDNQKVVLLGLSEAIRRELPKCKIDTAVTFFEARRFSNETEYDLIVSEIKIPGVEMYEYFEKFEPIAEKVPTIIFTTTPKEALTRMLLKTHIKGYVNKTAELNVLTDLIHKINNGEALPPILKIKTGTVDNPFHKLTRKEMQVAMSLINGYTNTDICEQLNLKPTTISTFKARLMDKLRVRQVVDLVHLAAAWGMNEE